jgi:hypothetical protein
MGERGLLGIDRLRRKEAVDVELEEGREERRVSPRPEDAARWDCSRVEIDEVEEVEVMKLRETEASGEEDAKCCDDDAAERIAPRLPDVNIAELRLIF